MHIFEVILSIFGVLISILAIFFTLIDRNKIKRKDALFKIIRDFKILKSELFLFGNISKVDLDITDSEIEIARSMMVILCAKELVDSTFESESKGSEHSFLYKGLEDFEFNGNSYGTLQDSGKTKVVVGNSYRSGRFFIYIPFFELNDNNKMVKFELHLSTELNSSGLFLKLYSKDQVFLKELKEWKPINKWLVEQEEKINKIMSEKFNNNLIFKKHNIFIYW